MQDETQYDTCTHLKSPGDEQPLKGIKWSKGISTLPTNCWCLVTRCLPGLTDTEHRAGQRAEEWMGQMDHSSPC